ncbi:peptidyl-tRNA hydrolase, PTH1 family [Pseudoxanthobacter soli DSM 19599]|uniref:Peptidyl-tRNA hydrolase n=1 Tax=Pseudoxanthobacter soli DSM 19599 TaxID=1123029 RepID=A0A1M7ZIH4_9HYPH|nr:aminoacyl-tRNA hydrolase [Pseudoxanthobacter soli]SHO64629.1 peptidyl-tRNA hydrolase, PTH1 family [Pseudoxanthobacter soli DSM 19599]
MLIMVGLGNPGSRYAANRHNVGFMAVDRIHQRHRFGPWRQKFQAEIAEGTLDDERVLLMKPLTYMNESGRAAGEAARFYKVDAKDVVVFHDELDLPPGKFRAKTGGGHGGHNGLRSLTQQLGDGYRRVRIGIGHPGAKELVHGYVLHDFAKADEAWLTPLLDAMAAEAPLLAEGKDATFANRVHLALQPGQAPRDQVPRDARPRTAAPGEPGAGETAPGAGAAAGKDDTAAKTSKAGGALAEGLARLFGGRK